MGVDLVTPDDCGATMQTSLIKEMYSNQSATFGLPGLCHCSAVCPSLALLHMTNSSTMKGRSSMPSSTTSRPAVTSRTSLQCRAAMQLKHDAVSMSRRGILLSGSILAAAQGIVLPHMPAHAQPLVLPAVDRIALGEGVNISRVVKGCWQLAGGHKGDSQTDRTSGKAALEDFTTFYNNGITTFDAADHYGPAELVIGKWLQQQSQAVDADIRSKVQVMTKVCVFDGVSMTTVTPSSMRQALDTSVRRLGTTPDVVQFYWGSYDIPRYVDAARYLSEEQARGRFKLLGVTNFGVKQMEEMEKGGVKIASNQLQYSLLDRRPDNGMVQYCQSQGIKLLPYGVLAGGLLSNKYLGKPVNSVQLDTWSKRKYSSVLQAAGGWDWFQQLLTVLNTVANKHDTSISNVAARWVLDRPMVAGVILGARNASHISDQVALSNLKLDTDDLASIQGVLDAGRRPRGDCYEWERGIGPF